MIEDLPSDRYAHFDPKYPDRIYIQKELIKEMEKNGLGADFNDTFSFFIGVKLMHEFVHYGDHNYNGDKWKKPGEEGDWFESTVYGYWVQYISSGSNKGVYLMKPNYK